MNSPSLYEVPSDVLPLLVLTASSVMTTGIPSVAVPPGTALEAAEVVVSFAVLEAA
jgi:hypothetical protein